MTNHPPSATVEEADRLREALRRFDAENARDPNQENVDGTLRPRELVYAQRLSAWVLRRQPEASEALLLAARSQHLCRWEIPRTSREMTRAGYLRWRAELRAFHARKSGEILRDVGYPDAVIQRVQALNLKQNFPHDPESRVLEDALCLVFLEFQLEEVAVKMTGDTLLNALRKSWQKMTPAAQAEAGQLRYGPRAAALIARALAAPS